MELTLEQTQAVMQKTLEAVQAIKVLKSEERIQVSTMTYLYSRSEDDDRVAIVMQMEQLFLDEVYPVLFDAIGLELQPTIEPAIERLKTETVQKIKAIIDGSDVDFRWLPTDVQVRALQDRQEKLPYAAMLVLLFERENDVFTICTRIILYRVIQPEGIIQDKEIYRIILSPGSRS